MCKAQIKKTLKKLEKLHLFGGEGGV